MQYVHTGDALTLAELYADARAELEKGDVLAAWEIMEFAIDVREDVNETKAEYHFRRAVTGTIVEMSGGSLPRLG